MNLTQLQTKEAVFIPKIGGLGLTLNQKQSGSNHQDLQLAIVDGGVKVSVKNPKDNKRYFIIIPWGTIKGLVGCEE